MTQDRQERLAQRHSVAGDRRGALLVAQPDVSVQVKADKFQARARTANAEEKPALWKQMAEIWPSYNDYQKRTDREIPVVILERA